MKLIITGGAGFIGSNLIRHLLVNRNCEILNIDKLCFPGSTHTIVDLSASNNYQFMEKDIIDAEAMQKIVSEFKPNAIFHLAAESHVDRSIDSPKAFINTNIVGTFSLLEAFRHYYLSCESEQKQEMKFIHVSTDEVYGSLNIDDPAFTEQHTYHPNSPYAASKAASDHLVAAWYSTYKLPLIITNCSNNFGPFQFPEKLIPLVIIKALTGDQIPVYGEGANIRDWLNVDDHVRALCHVLDSGQPGETYNIGGNNERSNLSIVNNICDILDELRPAEQSYRDLIEFVEDRPGHYLRYAIDSTKINSNLGWFATEDFEKSLRKTIVWYIDNQAWCANVCSANYNGQRLGLATT